MRAFKLPPCPLCWAPMPIDMCRDGFLCSSPHGTRGPVFVGHDDVESGKFELLSDIHAGYAAQTEELRKSS